MPEVQVFFDDKFGGSHPVRTTGDVDRTIGNHYNDKISSIIVFSGTWQFWEDFDYGGESVTLGPGRYPSVEAVGLEQGKGSNWNDRISAFRAVGF